MSVRFTAGSGTGLETSAATDTPAFPVSISVWFRISPESESDDYLLWWFGDESSPTNHLLLKYDVNSSKVVLSPGSGYNSGIGDLESSATVSGNEWHLATIVIEYIGAAETLNHTLYVDGQTTAFASDNTVSTTPPIADWDRVTVGRKDASPSLPLNGYIEQLAIWKNHALAESDHDKMWSDSSFDNLRRAPNTLGNSPDLGYWMLTGHHRHGLNVVAAGQQINSKPLGELVNSGTASSDPHLSVTGSTPPTWSVESPLVFYATETPASFPERVPKKAISRRSPRFTFFQKPELFTPWITNQGKHPVYDDPNCTVLGRCAFNGTNLAGRNPPVFEDLAYTPVTYITNVARRIADWSEYQGLWSGADPRFSDDDPYPGAVFVQTIGLQHDASNNEETYGTLGLNTDETTPAGGTHFGEGWGIPLQQHPKDSLIAASSPINPLGDWFVSLYSKYGVDLCRDWSDAFWASLKNELARRKKGGTGPSLAEPGRAIWDYESSPQPEKFCQQELPTESDPGNWWFHKCDNGSSLCTSQVARWTATDQYVVQIEFSGTFTNASLSSLGIAAPDITEGLRQPDNDDFRADIVGWDSPMRQEAVYNSFQAPAESTFPNLRWSNYWDLSADNTAFKAYFRDIEKDYNTPTQSRIRTKYSAPILYPPPGDQLLKFADPANFANGPRTRNGAFIALTMAMVDACVNAKRPLPLQPWIAGASTEIYKGAGTTNLIYTATQEDLRTILQYCWQRGCDEFNMFVSTDTTNDLPDDGEGWNGGVIGQQNGDNNPSEQADFDGTYEEVKALRDHIEFCSSERHERVCRTMRHSRRV